MDTLHPALVFEILSRLDDSADVARCRAAWSTFRTLSQDLRSINLQWPLERYIDLRSTALSSPTSPPLISPLKTIILDLISNLTVIESVRIGADNMPLDVSNADVEDYGDDMFLTDAGFLRVWLPQVSASLKSLSISDFWVQSSWRRSDALLLISVYCYNLIELDVKYAWLSVRNMNPMQMLTTLTLEFIKLEDKNLTEFNKSFPNLQVLNLIDVKGLKLPFLQLPNLKTCHWTITDAPLSVNLITPKLITLRLECIRLLVLYVEAPLLSHFHLGLDHVGAISFKSFENLKSLSLEASPIEALAFKFPRIHSIESLTVNSRDLVGNSKFTLKGLLTLFPTATCLCFKSRAWSAFEVRCGEFARVGRDRRRELKTFCGYLLMVDPVLTFSMVACVIDQCFNLVNVSLLMPRGVAGHVMRAFKAWCMARWPRVSWKWGLWEEGTEDSWIVNDNAQVI